MVVDLQCYAPWKVSMLEGFDYGKLENARKSTQGNEFTVEVESNGKLKVDELPKVNSNELWLVEYKVDGKTYNNHYVSYSPPMKFEIYKAWLSELRR